MTVQLYDEVLSAMDDTPRTKNEITSILYPNIRYASDRSRKSAKVYKALQQLITERKVKLDRQIIDGRFTPTYRLEDGSRSFKPQSTMELVLDTLQGKDWMTTRDLTIKIYGFDPIKFEIYRSRITGALNTLRNNGRAESVKSDMRSVFGTEINLWRLVQ